MTRKRILIPLSLLLSLAFSSCTKSEKKFCDLPSKYIYEPIVYDEDCQCIVAGKVKYIKNCNTAALLDYGNGTCDNVATKTICVNGKCEEIAGAYTVDFEFNCEAPIVEGQISDEEADILGI